MRLEPAIFDAVVTAAATSGLLEERPAGLAPVGWEPKLSDAQSALAERYLAALRAGGTSPPTDSPPPPALIAFLAERGELVNVGAGVVFAADVHASMLATMREFAAANGGITLAQARDLFATSRKYAQAFLEDLDARHITRRTGDLHTFRQARQPGD
jgi:selenocysteine-specific elongation factor